ncbi:MAG: MFS transporter [Desulfurococcaceae archaeon]
MARGSRRSLLIAALLAAYALAYFHRTMTGVMRENVEEFSRYYGVSESLLEATFFSAYFYAYAASQPITGGLLDAYGVRRAAAAMLALLAASTAIMIYPSPFGLVGGRALIGFSAAVVFLAAQRSLSLLFGRGSQATMTGVLLMIGNLSAAVGTLPLVEFLKRYGLSTLLALLALVAAALATLVYVLSTDVGGASSGIGALAAYRKLGSVARDPHAWGVGLATLSIYSTSVAYQGGWGQKHLASLGLSTEGAAEVLMEMALAFAVACPISGYLSDRVFRRRKPFLVIGPALSALAWALALLSLSAGPGVLPAFIAVLAIAYSFHMPAPPMAREPYGPQFSATAVGFYNVVLFAGLGALLTASAYVSPAGMCALSAALGVIGALAATMTRETFRA